MNRQEARAANAKKYDGKLCTKHNSTLRYVANCGCVACVNESSRASDERRVFEALEAEGGGPQS